MGNGVSIPAEILIKVAESILKDYSNMNFFRRLLHVYSAPNSCKLRENDDPQRATEDFMWCNFLRGQRESWEPFLICLFITIIALMFLSVWLWQRTTTVYEYIVNSRVSRQEAITNCSQSAEDNSHRVNMSMVAELNNANQEDNF